MSFLIFITIFISVSCIPKMGTVLFYPICRELQKEIIVSDKRDYSRIEGSNHIVYFKNENYLYVKEVSYSVEKNLEYLTKEFGFIPNHKVNIIIYNDYNEMAQKTKLGSGMAAVGAYYSGTVSILDNPKNKSGSVNTDSVILHELTHYILDYMCGGNIPVWFTEGVALYEEYKVFNHQWPIKRNGNFYSYGDLQNRFSEIDEISAYSQSFMIIDYIISNFGMKSVNDIIIQLSTGKSVEQAVEKVLKITIEELFNGYRVKAQ